MQKSETWEFWGDATSGADVLLALPRPKGTLKLPGNTTCPGRTGNGLAGALRFVNAFIEAVLAWCFCLVFTCMYHCMHIPGVLGVIPCLLMFIGMLLFFLFGVAWCFHVFLQSRCGS